MTYPEPEVRARPATAEQLARNTPSLMRRAQTNGWACSVSYARGVPPDAQGLPEYEVERVPQWEEDNKPVLTPSGKQAMKESRTDRLVLVDSVVLRMFKDDRWIVVIYENRSFSVAFTNLGRRLKANDVLREVLA